MRERVTNDQAVVLIRLLQGDGLTWLKGEDTYRFRRRRPDPIRARCVWPLLQRKLIRPMLRLSRNEIRVNFWLTARGREVATKVRELRYRSV